MHHTSHTARILFLSCAATAFVSSTANAQAGSPFVKEVSGDVSSWQQFSVDIPEGTSSLDIVLSGGTGDADLYVRFGSDPTQNEWDCRPYKDSIDETCSFAPAKAGTYHIGVNAYTAYSGVKVTSTWKAADKNEPTKIDDWKQSTLDRHNTLRADHCAPALSWDEEVAAAAQAYADKCIWEHDKNNKLGENLSADTQDSPLATLMPKQVDGWYAENADYDFANPGFSAGTGHFTQLVWRATTQLGCGVAQCPPANFGFTVDDPNTKVKFLVCRYAPGGNVAGDFPKNVLPKTPADMCPAL